MHVKSEWVKRLLFGNERIFHGRHPYFECPDKSLLQGRQTSKCSFNSMRRTYPAIVFHENTFKYFEGLAFRVNPNRAGLLDVA